MSGITKNQHFVPRLLLKNFAEGEDGAVQIYDSGRDILRPPTSVRRVLSQNNFYDDDNVIENFLAVNVEAPAAPIIEGIIGSPASPIPDKCIDLLRFIAVQMNRTPQALDTALEVIDKYSRTLFQRIGELNGFPADSTAGLRLKMTDERSVLAMQTLDGALNWPLFEDLSWHVLSNGTDLPFVISDHPVVHHNWYLRDSDDPSYTSITKAGIQIFLPLSPSITLALIDKSIYKFGFKGSHQTTLTKRADIELLNSLQLRARDSFVVFPMRMDTGYVKSQCTKNPSGSLFKSHAWSSVPEAIGNDQLKSTHAVWRTQVALSGWLSISKIKRRMAKRGPVCIDRRPEVVQAHKVFVERARRK